MRAPERLIALSVDRIIHVTRDDAGRRVEAVLAVGAGRDGGYETRRLA
ncbi:hypothetical protein [Brevundimonas sp.]|nr:hypothetical protein [Brevundimonas sp.]